MATVFHIAQPKPAPYISILVILILLLGLVIFLLILSFSLKTIRYELTDTHLVIKSIFYGRKIDRRDIDTGSVRLLNLNLDREYAPVLRTDGIGLPGLSCGWFKLRNGQRALLFVTRRVAVLCFRTHDYSVLLSASEPEGLYAALSGN